MRPSVAPLLWRGVQGRGRRSDPFAGFAGLGLSYPSTLWLGSDQASGLPSIVTRYGFAWSKNEQDGGTLSLDATTWGGGLSLVKQNGSGANIRVGLRCDSFAPGVIATNAMFYTIACPIYFPTTYPASGVFEFSYNGPGDNDRYGCFWNTKTPGLSLTRNGTNVVLAAYAPVNTTNDPALQRKVLFCQTARDVGAGNLEVAIAVRTSAGTYVPTPKTVSSATAGEWSRFAQGYNPITATAVGAASSDCSYGGAVGWKGVGATNTQMLAILDTWQSLYPL